MNIPVIILFLLLLVTGTAACEEPPAFQFKPAFTFVKGTLPEPPPPDIMAVPAKKVTAAPQRACTCPQTCPCPGSNGSGNCNCPPSARAAGVDRSGMVPQSSAPT